MFCLFIFNKYSWYFLFQIQISAVLLIITLGGRSVWCSTTPPASNSSQGFSFRTSLHVARSLNPESTENLSVKTKSGDIATIIVKKREGSRNIRNFWLQDDKKWKPISRSELVSNQRSFPSISNVTTFDRPVSSSSNATQSSSIDTIKDAQIKTEIPRSALQQNIAINVKSTVKLDQKEEEHRLTPSTTTNSDQKVDASTVFNVITTSPYQSEKSTRSINSADSVYPQPTSTGTYSEVNFIPIQSRSERKLVPNPITITSALSLGSQSSSNAQTDENRHSRKLYVDPDGIPVITGIRVPDDESDRQVWRNARVINGILVPYAKNHNSKYPQKDSHISAQPTGTHQWIKSEQNSKKPMGTIIKENKPFRSEVKMSSTNPPPLNVMLIEEQDDKWEKLGTVSNINIGDNMSNRFRPSSVWIKDDIRHSQDQNYVSDKILDYIKQINQHETSHRSVRKVEDRDARAFLEEEAGRSYFTSTTLMPPRVSFEGVRTPVLQYAHPELGVQPAKVVSTTAPQKEPEVEPILDSRAQALAYFAHDIHADRSPFAFEPGLEEEARVQESFDSKPIKPISRPKKTLTYPSPKYVDSNMPYGHHNKYEYSSKYPFSYKGYGGYYTHVHEPEKPMWRKISDTVKDHVQNGFEKVSNLTRPVVEPLMEATNKISQNLGLSSGNRDLHSFKEKVGLAGGPSILLPALGLVAGGAALGLGAVAIGR